MYLKLTHIPKYVWTGITLHREKIWGKKLWRYIYETSEWVKLSYTEIHVKLEKPTNLFFTHYAIMSNIPNCLQVFSLQFCPKSGNSIFDPKPKRLLKWLCCFGVIVTIYTLHCVTSGLYVISTFVSYIVTIVIFLKLLR